MNDTAKDAGLRAAIIAVIEGSATFEERAAAKGMIAKPSSADEVKAICQVVGASPDDMRVRGPIESSFARLYASASFEMPAWGSALETLLVDPAPAPGDELALDADDHETAHQLAVAFSGFLRTAGAWLDHTVASSGARISPAGRRGLLAWLRRAWTAHARHVIGAEQRTSGVESMREYAEKLASRDGWLTLLSTYPVLGRLLGTELALWQRECELLVRRLVADWSALGETGEPTLVDVSPLALKRSLDAPPPLLVTLASGRRIVYRGKDLRIVAWFADLLSELARGGMTPALEPCTVLARERHAWADYIEPSPCTDDDQIDRYYTRVGMYLRLFQALRTVDMHGRNVIAVNEHPVFIDLETLLHPPRTVLGGSPVEQAARERYDASPLAVGLLPLWVTGEPGHRAVNLGGLNRGGDVVFPGAHTVTQVTSTLPRIGDKPSAIGDHLPQILAGYRAMSALVTDEHLRAHLEGAANLRVAVLWRSFFMYKRMADTSVVPLLLTDGRVRDAFLTRIVLGVPDDRSRTLALGELRAIRDGASPSFEAQPASDAMHLPDGSVVPGVFAAPALDRVTLVRTALDASRDRDAIASAIGCEAQFHGDPPPAAKPGVTAPADASTPLAHAIAIADFILGEAITAGDEMMWIGATWLPTSGTRRIDTLPLDLLSGSAGIAVMFAYLHERSGEPRFREAATCALGPIRRDVLESMARGRFRGGAFLGAGAQLYALGKCSELLDDWTLLELVKRYLAAVPSTLMSPGAPRDVVMGAAGLVLVAANLLPPSARPANLAHVAAELRQQPADGRALYVDGERWLAGLPIGHEGVAWALARWDGADTPAALPDNASPLTRIACAPPSAAPIDAFGAREPRPGLPDLVLALAARDAYRDHALTERARSLADAIVARRRDTGRWLDDAYVAERYHLSAISGLAGLALAFARIDAPQLPCCARLAY